MDIEPGDVVVRELRCPVGPKRLLMKVLDSGGQPYVDPGSNLLELACSDCKRALRAQGRQVTLVVHRFNLIGELVESVVVP